MDSKTDIILSVFGLVFSTLLLHGVASLKGVHVQVPVAVRRWDNAILGCIFDLEGESLYSVKWYRGKREFYRYTPKEIPAVKVFSSPGLQVDITKSNVSQVTLQKVDLNLSGRYSCEVSADAPLFHTAVVSGELTVVDFPKTGPVITGLRRRYSVGDVLEANCTSSRSKPAATLTWMINENPANRSNLKYYPPEHGSDHLEAATVGLAFEVTSAHFRGGPLKLQCNASIYSVYQETTEASVDHERPRLSSVRSSQEDSQGRVSAGDVRKPGSSASLVCASHLAVVVMTVCMLGGLR